MRLIDADVLKSKAVQLLFPTKMEPCGHIPVPVYAVVVAEIEHAQTIDAVPVARCRECTEFNGTEHECSHWYGFRENDFCAYGERKEGAEL